MSAATRHRSASASIESASHTFSKESGHRTPDWKIQFLASLNEVRRRGLLERTLFSSFFDPVLARLRALCPAARIALLVSRKVPEGALARAARLGAEALNPERSVASPELIGQAHDAGLDVHVFTVDEEARLRHFLELGVDGIFTNTPDRLRRLLPRS